MCTRFPLRWTVGLTALALLAVAGCGGPAESSDLLDTVASLVAGEQDAATLETAVGCESGIGRGARGGPMAQAADNGEDRPRPPHGDPLELTDEQRALAEEIFALLHEDIEVLRDAARADFEALLSEEQLALLEELMGNHEGEGPPPNRPPRFPYCGTQQPEPPEHDGLPPHMQRLANALALSEQQTADWLVIHDETRSAIEARRDEACEEFRAILTDEQLAILDELPPPPPGHGPGGPGGPGGPDGPGGPGGPGGPRRGGF